MGVDLLAEVLGADDGVVDAHAGDLIFEKNPVRGVDGGDVVSVHEEDALLPILLLLEAGAFVEVLGIQAVLESVLVAGDAPPLDFFFGGVCSDMMFLSAGQFFSAKHAKSARIKKDRRVIS